MHGLSKSQKLVYDMDKYAGGSISVICGSMLIEGIRNQAELTAAINGLYRINAALRTRITETDGQPTQSVLDYAERDIDVLCFENKAELDRYAEAYAKVPVNLYGDLCEIRAILLPDRCGFLIKLHHIIGDAWALALICSQFIALLNGEAPQAFPYTEHLENESAYLQRERYAKDRAFFLEQFKKCDEVTYLSEKQGDSFTSKRKTFVIDSDRTAQITDYAKQSNVSPFVLFMTAAATYISRTKLNAEKFYIGTAVLNRSGVREKNTVGMFIDTAPVLIELDSEKSFSENLSAVKKSAFSVFRHQKFNYGDVLSAIRGEYGFTEKLYDVMLSYQNATIAGAKAESTWYHNGAQAESLQIHIDDRDSEGIFRIHFDYQIDKFTEHEIERMYGHVIGLLLDAVRNDSKPLYALEMLSENEKQELLHDFNDTEADYPRDKCVHQLFEEQVRKTPDETAVIACDETLTYGELNDRVNRIANSLREQGVKPGDIVAFVLSRKSYLIAAMFGILKTGAAYLPIDPDYPQDRIQYMIEDSKAAFFITEENIAALLACHDNHDPNVAITRDNPCYCIYTSGSTGRPKGTVLTHGNVANYIHSNDYNVVHKIIKGDYQSIVSVTTVGFDIFVTESILALINGLEIILADERQAMLQSELNALLLRYKADVLQTTPTKMRSLIGDTAERAYLKSLKAIVLGGEALDSSLVYTLKQLTPAHIFNIYGPTETTVWSAIAEVLSDTNITIGKPIANTQIYIVDRFMQLVPVGVAGELCIAGDGVCAGYLNRPDLTAEKFIDNPFGTGKLYRTGDLAYWREDGNIVYIGRNDFQVKIRGLRVELGEIENAIQEVQGIAQAAVAVRRDGSGRQLICAFYTGQETDGKTFRATIGQKLPKYMLPHSFTHLDELPLTANGKINRKALPEVDLDQITTAVEYVAPVGEIEIQLAAIMEQVLGRSAVGREDDFFDLGGDSLKAIEMISAMENAGYHTDVKTLFECGNVRDLAVRLTPAARRQVVYGEAPDEVLATPAQLRVYTAQIMQGGTAYNVPYVFQAGSVDPERLQKAVQALVARHDILRTHFEDKNGRIVQVVEHAVSIQIEHLDTDDISVFVRPFDLSKAPLLRVGYCGNTVMVDMHHIITDGASMPIFLRELNELYMGRTLTSAPTSYRQFAMQAPDYKESEAYWLSVYSDEPPVLELNPDFKREQKRDFSGNALYESIDFALHQKILTVSRKIGVTPYVFYIGGFYILLSKFSGNEDIVVGTPMSGRTGAYLDTIGMFVNTVALRGKPAGTKTVNEFLTEIKRAAIDAVAHQDYPYGELVRKLGVNTTDRNPLYDVMFAFQSEEMTDVVFGDEKAELLPVPITTSKYDFAFNLMPMSKGVTLMVEYCTALYREATMRRLIEGYGLVLSQMLNGEGLLKDISAITERETNTLLHDFNDTAVDYPRDKCVHQLFEEQARKTPDKAAVIACDETLTYGELNSRANRIANGLIERGVKPGDIVAFMLQRKSGLIAAMFGILKAGAAYLPIDLDYPQDRVAYMIADSGAKLLLTDDLVAELLENEDTADPAVPMTSQSPCYCIYTSGSTGTPKGTLQTHKSLMNFCTPVGANNLQRGIDHNCNTVLAWGSITFDISIFEIILSLALNKTVVLASERELGNPMLVADLINRNHIDCIHATPTRLCEFLNVEKFSRSFQQVKCIMSGGEQFSSKAQKMLLQYNVKIFNGYGPTETTCGVCFGEITSNDITIGKPIANTQIYIVDQYLNPVPIGTTGELCIAGDGVGLGYLNRPELTAERFIQNPFGPGRLYKTGDLAYWREDGNIIYVGRSDFQVKVRGLRIELGEIETAISAVEGIAQAVVVVRKDETGRQFICAFFTETASVPVEQIKSALRERLPRYMMPHTFTCLESLPMTASGKVDRKALPAVDLTAIQSEVEYVAPKTPPEIAVTTAAQAVLSIERVSLLDNFFDLGGDSLKTIELIAKLEQSGFRTDTKTIFACATMTELAAALEVFTPAEDENVPTGDIPATAAQLRVYTAQEMQGGTAYNVPYVFRAKSVDPERLQQAVVRLIERHEILRTRFENREGKIIQVTEDSVPFALECLDNADVSAFVRPFDLSKAPLIRVGYYGDTVMVDMHHAVTDGGSIAVFFRELNELYMGRALPDAPVQYRAFAARRQDMADHEDYWPSVYQEELPELAINTDFKRGQKQSFHGGSVYDSLDSGLHERILVKCKALNVTPYVFYLGGYYVLMSKFSGNEDMAIGTPSSGREGKFLNTLGMFVNTLAVRNRPEGEKSVQNFLWEVKESSLAALEHQAYPYGDLVKKLGLQAQGRNPLFDVMFAYQDEAMTTVTFGDKPAELLPVPVTTSKYDITFNVLPRQSDIVVMVEYCTDLYKERSICRFLDGYKLILAQMLDETRQIKELSPISEDERHTLLATFNDTAADYPKDKCVHQLFEEQVRRTPDKTAVIACDRTLTYGELNDQANRIANGLIERGVKPGDIVAFVLPRRSYLIAVMFGILKAGAAYLPIDLDYPQNRVDYMLTDSGAKLLLTNDLVTELLNTENATDPAVPMTSQSSCYCIYTSGSTGNPKGIIQTHQNVANFIQSNDKSAFQRTLIKDNEYVISCNAISFDITLQEIHLPILNGLGIILIDDNQIYNIGEATHLFEGKKCGLIITPTKLELYLANPSFCNSLKNCSVIMCGAETFPPKLYQTLRAYTSATVFNGYGPTETTCGVCYGEITSDDITIGKPIANTQIYIVDRYMQPVPVGVAGELCIAGDGVGAGYLNRPELTAEKFIDNPFGKGKLYKTGDLAYWREDGNIVYIGRNDFQVKIRGLRIELGEIENALQGVEGVAQAVVVVRRDENGRQLICAFYTGQKTEGKALRAAIGQKLPKYMLPHIFTHLDALPLTSSGKVSRKALPEVDLSNIASDVEYVKPTGEMESQLAAIMEKVLNYSPVGMDDDFFDLGGDSLKAIEFVSKAHTEGIYFALQSVFDNPTVRQLAQHIKAGDKQTISFSDADFTEINKILERNKIEYISVPQKADVGNLLLAGATGYLGIHILANFIEREAGLAYCLVRGKDQADSEQRLNSLLNFYFGNRYAGCERIKVLCGDLQKEQFGLSEQEYAALDSEISMVINAAASVKHYGPYQYFKEVNIDTTERLIHFCQEGGAKLLHISTLSVSGNGFDTFDGYVSQEEKHFYESDFYFGQPLDNVYARSKFEAERMVLEAVAGGLQANILRMGNLTSRRSDGVFQKNYESNAFLKRVKGLLEFGIIPDYLLPHHIALTPVDEAANAIMTIAGHFSTQRTAFHISTTKMFHMGKLVEDCAKLGFPLKVVSGKEFTAALRKTAKESGMEYIFETFITDLDSNEQLAYDSRIRIENSFTEEYLNRLGFAWAELGVEYLRKYFEYLKKIGYLQGGEENA